MRRSVTRFLFLLALGTTFSLPAQEFAVPPKRPAPSKRASEARRLEAQKRAKADAAARAKATDINRASREELLKLPGMTPAYADAVIAKRPYKVKADLVVKGAIPEALYLALRKQVAVKPAAK